MVEIRRLTGADAQAFQSLRLRALLDHPEAFGRSHAEEAANSLESVVERLDSSPEISPTFGAWQEGQLVGSAGIVRYTQTKTRHRAFIWGMYVAPEVRGHGVGKALMDTLISHALTLKTDGLEEVILSVAVGNDTARRLYVNCGFESDCVEHRELKIDGRYYDLERMSLLLDSPTLQNKNG